ncbi:aldehyde dehydrogenase family protein (plasmid) [Embleya sp. NBC_00888]|uniref:aldehyde dehydrogenase family protein n=1 Tax=Embleya sp. NBC_00888 TaxID=2975960 RepID=UPI002F90E41A|nr:aldehyde dehydrogenase family protein [Embleya sp. NBC_00888]
MTSSDDLAPAFPTVDGADFATADSFDVVNPATGEILGAAPAIRAEDLDHVFGSAADAFRTWSRNDDARRRHLRAAADALDADQDRLSRLLTLEQGKPLHDSVIELQASSAWLRYYADLGWPDEVLRDDSEGYEAVRRRPIGVVAAITPWNFPILLAVWKIAPALRAGNTVVVKPSPYTPLTTLAVGAVLRKALPPGVLNVVSGPDPLGAAMVAHPVPRKISFTGSTATGMRVAAAAGEDLKRTTLELGGNDPAIVLADADVDAIARDLFWGAFGNNGQICLAVKRVYAHENIHDRLVEALASIARDTKVDDGLVPGAELGPINNAPQFDRVSDLVADALGRGARAACGGAALDRPGYFYAPTILDNLDDGVRVVDEEQFGPVLPIVAFRDERDAVERANRSNYGLTASVWSGDPDHAYAIAERVDGGQVSVNTHGGGVRMHLPFGGHKWSGIGVENGPWGLLGFTELQVVTGPARGNPR